MPEFKVHATMDVGYVITVTARNSAEAWTKASDMEDGWECLGGEDWTLGHVVPLTKEEVDNDNA